MNAATIAERRADARNLAGFRQAHVARSTGTLVLVLDGEAAGLDTDAGRWQTVCDDHGYVISHETLALARFHATAPEEWCEVCMGTEPIDTAEAPAPAPTTNKEQHTMDTTPKFTILDNGDGTATISDGGLPVVTLYRERGNVSEVEGQEHKGTTYLSYVAQGIDYKPKGARWDGPSVHASCASRTMDERRVTPAEFVGIKETSVALHAAGLVADTAKNLDSGVWSTAEVREWATGERFSARFPAASAALLALCDAVEAS